MCNLSDIVEEEGIEKGIEMGIAMTKKIFQLKLKGKTIAEIAEICEMDEKEVRKVLEED